MSSSIKPKRRKLSVLLVEDLETDRVLMEHMLHRSMRYECTIKHVRKMSAAVELVNKTEFDLVILDLTLLDSDPDETIKRLALIPYRTPTIITSGALDDENSARAIQMGADACLDKNRMSVLVLCDAIRDAIGRRAQKLKNMNFPIQLRHLRELIDHVK